MQDVTSVFKMYLFTLTQFMVSRKRVILALFVLFLFSVILALPPLVSICRRNVSEKWNEGWQAWKSDDPQKALECWSVRAISLAPGRRPSRFYYWRIRALERLDMYQEAEKLKKELARKYPFDFYTFLFFKDGGASVSGSMMMTKSLFYPFPWAEEVRAASDRTGLSEKMIWSLMRQESKFRRGAVSRSGALGLMQLMPSTAKDEMAYLDLKSPDIISPGNNILIGASYFVRMNERFRGELPRTLAAYNAGMMPVIRWNTLSAEDWVEWIEEIPYPETRDFIRAVLENMEIYSLISGEGPDFPISRLMTGRPMPVEKMAYAKTSR